MTSTTNYGWEQPTNNADTDTWGTKLRTFMEDADADLKAVSDTAGLKCAKASNLSDLASAATSRTNLGVTATGADTTYNYRANNLSDVASASTARTNLGVTATGSDTTYSYRANNLSDLADAATARTNLGLGTAATSATSAFDAAGTGASQASAAQSAAIAASCQRASNLSDVSSASTARSNLGLGSFATKAQTVSTSAASGTPADGDVWLQYTP